MNRPCMRMHDHQYPQEAVLAFCTKVDCDKRFLCGRCYHDYHSDHLPQIVPIKNLPMFINAANIQMQETFKLMDKLQAKKKHLIQTIEQLCINLQIQDFNDKNNVTEEILHQILKGNQNPQSTMIRLQDVISDFGYVDDSWKKNIRIDQQVKLLNNLVCIFIGILLLLIIWIYKKDDGIKTQRETILYEHCSYHGQFSKGQVNGQGTLKLTNGDQYDGELIDHKKNGRGVYKYANGNIYDGEWKDDKKNGRGVYKWADGDIYDGEFKEDKKNGRGVYKWASGAIYDGKYKDDMRNGRGVYKWASGDMYDGDWLDDKRTGSGKFIYSNGNTYKYQYISEIGKWKDSQQQGDHELYELKKTSIITYKDNKEIKRQYI